MITVYVIAIVQRKQRKSAKIWQVAIGVGYNGNLTDVVIAEHEDFENEYYEVWEYKDGCYDIVDGFNDYDKAKTLKDKLEKGE